ncbi:MAG: replication initiator protein A, partial [Firmicutes bacterium]|nr:replication initiator protein A [Bacillota bacterium]
MINTIPEKVYFHGNEIEQFIHIQVPIALIKDKMFKGISTDAKLLYGLLLNRTGLSIK